MIVPGLRPDIRISFDGHVGFAVLDFCKNATGTATEEKRKGALIATDLRLDDQSSLRETLALSDALDDDLVGESLRRWGIAAPVKLFGEFAFAHWDRSRGTLICARDIFGIRPLAYVYKPPKYFAFASLPRALHQTGLVEQRLDASAIAGQIVHSWVPGRSLCMDVARLPAAHALEVGTASLSLHRYWDVSEVPANLPPPNRRDAAQHLSELLLEAVRCRLPAGSPVGAHLSGGLDSSAIAILAARILREQGRTLRTYSFLSTPHETAIFEDEAPFVESVLQQESNLEWRSVRFPPANKWFWESVDRDRIVSTTPEAPENVVCQDASSNGADVLLSGWGGDEGATFNGRGALAEALIQGRWNYFLTEVFALAHARSWTPWQIFSGEVIPYLKPNRRLPPLIRHLRSLIAPPVRQQLGHVRDYAYHLGPDAAKNHRRLLASPLIAERAEDWATIGARYGIAFSFPLLDRRLVEFVSVLPGEYFIVGGATRRVFRDAMDGILPEQVRLRTWKLMPFPDQPLGVVEHQNELRRFLAKARLSESVRQIFLPDLLDSAVDSFPSAERLALGRCNESELLPVITMLMVLPAINYARQNF
ncbi:asparagine synthase-related protein [Mesorhizobium sp.]|uniref:asparagine synthase-related protein n=1 Tax=Mesorhizobium sp. TaxID=1871066 RepID=UPI00338DC0EB